MRFPVTIRHRTSKAKIYAPRGKFAYYRLAYATAGKRRMKTFANYSDAKAAAERIVRELSDGSLAAALNVTQSRDAIAAFERLQNFFQASGRRVSLLAAVSEFVEASGKLGGRTMSEAVEGYGSAKARFRQDGGLCGINAGRTLFHLVAFCAGRNNYLDGMNRKIRNVRLFPAEFDGTQRFPPISGRMNFMHLNNWAFRGNFPI